jgi:hypothetical protein
MLVRCRPRHQRHLALLKGNNLAVPTYSSAQGRILSYCIQSASTQNRYSHQSSGSRAGHQERCYRPTQQNDHLSQPGHATQRTSTGEGARMPLLLLAIRLGLLLPEPLRAQDTPSPVTRMAGGLDRETTATPYPLIELILSGINQVFSGGRPQPARCSLRCPELRHDRCGMMETNGHSLVAEREP